MIVGGYFAQIKNYPETDILICVARKYPWFVKKGMMEHNRILAPSPELLADWKKGTTWEEYEKRYRFEMLSTAKPAGAFRDLRDLAKNRVVRLLCWEKKPPCHRFILLDLLKEYVDGF